MKCEFDTGALDCDECHNLSTHYVVVRRGDDDDPMVYNLPCGHQFAGTQDTRIRPLTPAELAIIKLMEP